MHLEATTLFDVAECVLLFVVIAQLDKIRKSINDGMSKIGSDLTDLRVQLATSKSDARPR
jgi:hypothetical protein